MCRKVGNIAALFVETDGSYYGLPGVDPWDEARDARRYVGPHPVVAHPPCQRWGKLWAGQPLHIKRTGQRKIKGDDNGCFAAALKSVRTHGGVIEHPWGSHAWAHFGLRKPPRSGGWVKADEQDGWTCCVEQGRYGHYARKPTMLLAYGIDRPELDWGESEPRLDLAIVARMGLKRAKRLGEVGGRGGGKDSTPRIHTPIPFRDLLISMARSVNNVVKQEDLSLQETTCSATQDDKMTRAYPAANKEKSSVSFNFTVQADTAEEFVEQLRVLAALVSPSLHASTAAHPVAGTDPVEPVETVRKPRASKKAGVTIEHEEKANVVVDSAAQANGASSAGAADTGDDGGEHADGASVPSGTGAAAEDYNPAEVDGLAAAGEPPIAIDELRVYSIRKYLNVCYPTLPEQKTAWESLLAEFGVANLKVLPLERANEFKARVDALIAEKAKA